jgi:hypothetical protein
MISRRLETSPPYCRLDSGCYVGTLIWVPDRESVVFIDPAELGSRKVPRVPKERRERKEAGQIALAPII